MLEQERQIVDARPEFLVVRVDRTDPSKNVMRGFRAFAPVPRHAPDLRGRVVLLALLDPSRQDIPEYSEYLGAIQREARVVNDRFQTEGWTPIDLRIADNFAQSVAAYKQYDVLLVNAVFDGLNLVSKEAPLVNGRDGVLVLSENAGAHEELGEWALTVNPVDVYGQAQAIYAALTMPAEERRAAARGDARPRARARPGGVDRGAARRSRPGRAAERVARPSTITRMATTSAPELVSVNPATLEPVGAVRARIRTSCRRRRGRGRRAGAVAGARSGCARAGAARGGPRRACARGRDRRVDRRRDGEAAHRGDRARPYPAVDHARVARAQCIARAGRRARALLAAAPEDEEGLARATSRSASSLRSRRGTSRSGSRLQKWQQPSPPATGSC